ncbi:MAG: phytoene desaturase [Deltaproteobacteria bacterium]|nr:phytoene desaturase [Deltaproteobacteria bacterium]
MADKRCAIIGGGLGGLAAAVRIAGYGIAVDLYEQHDHVGGKANELHMEGFRFDTGPSLLTMPFVLESLFADVGEDVRNYFTINPLAQHCKYFYPDSTEITAFADSDDFMREIATKTTESAANVKKYLSYSKGIYGLSADLFLFNDIHEFSTYREQGSPKTLLNLWKLDSLRTVHRANTSFFRDPRVVQLFDRYTTYNGSNPYKAPATLNIIPHVEYNMGSFIVREGIYRIPQALGKLAEKQGVTMHTNRRVERIVHANKQVQGILVDSEMIPYDFVCSNADVVTTYRDLLKDETSRDAKRYRHLEPSSSALVFFWGVRGGVSKKLSVHNILFSSDYKEEFGELFDRKVCPRDPTVYIYCSSLFNPADAPKGNENWFVMINAPYDDGQDWEHETQESRKRIVHKIDSLLHIDIERNVTCERITTPQDIAVQTMSHRGSIYGISSNSRTAAFMRQRNRSKRYRGLYFCGGSAHPGGGIPLVLLSGKICADLVKRFEL